MSIQHHPSHLFQPIGMSQSSSSTSFGEAVAAKDGGLAVAEVTSSALPAGKKRPTLVEEEPKVGGVAVALTQKPLRQTESGSGRAEYKQKSSSAHIEDENFKAQAELSAHQRSRSNEMDYFSLRLSDTTGQRSSLSAFKSLMQPARQLAAGSGIEGASSGLRKEESHSMVSPLHSPKPLQQPNTSCLSTPPDATPSSVTTSEEKACPPASRGEGSRDAVGSGDVMKKEKTGTSQNERYSWLKDFDSPLWSNYLTLQEDSHYSDC